MKKYKIVILLFGLLMIGCSKNIAIKPNDQKSIQKYIIQDFTGVITYHYLPAKTTFKLKQEYLFEKALADALHRKGYGVELAKKGESASLLVQLDYFNKRKDLCRLSIKTNQKEFSRLYRNVNGLTKAILPWSIAINKDK